MNAFMTFGIDVGTTGSIGIVDARGQFVAVEDLPVMFNGKCKWIDSFRLLEIYKFYRQKLPAHSCIEYTHATPKVASTTANSMGLTLGSTLAAVQLTGTSMELISPLTWKRHYGLIFPKGTSDHDKKAACLAKARMLFPTAQRELNRCGDHNRGEALLIALWSQSLRASVDRACSLPVMPLPKTSKENRP